MSTQNEYPKKIDRLPVDAAAAVEFVSEEIASWEGVLMDERTGNRVEFWLGDHLLGYIPSPPGEVAVANMDLPEDIHDDLIAAGCTRLRPMDQDHSTSAGWVSILMETIAEVAFAIDLFQHCYKRVVKKSGWEHIQIA